MLKIFDNRYEIPDQSYFSRTAVPELYAITRRRVAEQVAAVRYFASTTDLWLSIDLTPFISYTIMFVTDNLELECLSHCNSYLPQDHTGEIISDMLEASLEEWSFKSSQQVCITTDNAANIKLAAENLGWTQLSCFGHNLHLAITKAIAKDNRSSRALGIAQKIVSAFSVRWKR
ncbi:PREDICTED: zinc finger BED domain-containing protein 4-like [Amphimedon queenslandica]|uniref:DUF659 domain-containing protein n=1 Tax=Amphimedon queenslandica TaxID=400682 RepID=A0A1X7UDG8_AMPQE|nr:PREDICTED: zinc finger BED domain-containing protein 4-like [Amphimedon queenslandica]|eukprot:XP_011405487.1 PREDICTED: zinc finger BED domain-containing protein 4-like [Amphimedon queenslandica]